MFIHNAGVYLLNKVKLVLRQISAAGFCMIFVAFSFDKLTLSFAHWDSPVTFASTFSSEIGRL